MRYNSPEHLDYFKKTGRFPAIHAPLVNFIRCWSEQKRFLDLGCGYGLLGELLMRCIPAEIVIGVDKDANSLADARRAGVTTSCAHYLPVIPENYGKLTEIIMKNRLQVLVARRVFPELFGDDPSALPYFAALMRNAGITEIFVQGRKPVPNPTNRLHNIDMEIQGLLAHYSLYMRENDMAFMVAKQ